MSIFRYNPTPAVVATEWTGAAPSATSVATSYVKRVVRNVK